MAQYVGLATGVPFPSLLTMLYGLFHTQYPHHDAVWLNADPNADTKLPFSLCWKIPGITGPIERSTGARSTRTSIKFIINTQLLSGWQQNMLHPLRL